MITGFEGGRRKRLLDSAAENILSCIVHGSQWTSHCQRMVDSIRTRAVDARLVHLDNMANMYEGVVEELFRLAMSTSSVL